MNKPILEIKDLTIALPKNADRNFAVENADLDVFKGEILFIVGESGSGKSVMTSAILNDIPTSLKVTSGSIVFKNQDILKLSQKELNKLRGANISMIYQEPMAALNPSIRVGKQVDEVFALHRPEIKSEHRKSETLKLLNQMKLPNPERIYSSYAHQVSGGQCQRIVIAMALACNPDILIADEPTTALDVTVQKQIVSLIGEMQSRHGATLLFVTHDLGVVSKVCQSLSVLFLGKSHLNTPTPPK